MDFQELPAGRRISWACDRKTTREEDTAYSLMGLLDVNMPLLYGEGGEKAFYRLQQEYLLQREDLSLLLWTSKRVRASKRVFLQWHNQKSGRHDAILARHPVSFHRVQTLVTLDPETGYTSCPAQDFEWANVVPVPHEGDPLVITSRGLRVKLLAVRDHSTGWPGWIAYTSCIVMGIIGQPDRKACISLKPTVYSPYSDTVKGSTPTVTRENCNAVLGVPDLKGFEWQEFYLDYRYEKKRVKQTLAWPPENAVALQKHFDASTLEIRLDVPENAKVGASIFPPELGLINGTSGKYELTPELLSFPAVDASCLSLQIGALVLEIPVPAPPDSTPVIETVAITFGFTGAGSRSEALRGVKSLHGSLVWCDIVRILPEARPAEAMEKFLRGLGDRAFSTVLPDPKDKCRCNLGCGMTVWAFVRRHNWGRMEGENVHSFFTIHVVLQDEANLNPESQPRWLSSQMNASLFPDAPRDWR